MKSAVIIIGMTVCLLMIPALTQAIHETQPAETLVPLPGPNAEALYRYITVEDSYDNWQVWPGKTRKTKARAPLNRVTTYVNENALYSIHLGKPMVNGSIIVTENYDKAGKLTDIFVMYKIKGYNPDAGDWFWASYSPKGRPLSAGRVKKCIECHSNAKHNDYILTEPFIK